MKNMNANVDDLICRAVKDFFGNTPNEQELVRQAEVYLVLLSNKLRDLMPMKDLTSTDYQTVIKAFHKIADETHENWMIVLEVANYAYDKETSVLEALYHYFSELDKEKKQDEISPQAICILRMMYCNKRCFLNSQLDRCYQNMCTVFQGVDIARLNRTTLDTKYLIYLQRHLQHAFCTSTHP